MVFEVDDKVVSPQCGVCFESSVFHETQMSHGDVPQALWAMGVQLTEEEKDEVVNIVLR